MSVELIVEVLKHAPADLNPTERLTLVVIAESCRTGSRTTYYRDTWDADELARRVGITADSLTKVFRSLAKKGCEVRVPHMVKDGKPIFAFKGKQTTFKLPRFAPQSPDDRPPFDQGDGAEARTSVRESPDENPGNGPQSPDERPPLLLKDLPSRNTSSLSVREAATTAAPAVPAQRTEREDEDFSQEPDQDLSLVQRLIAKHGATGDAISFIEGWIDFTQNVQGPGFYFTADRNGSLALLVADALKAYNLEEQERTGKKCTRCDGYAGEWNGDYFSNQCLACHGGGVAIPGDGRTCPKHPQRPIGCDSCRAERLASASYQEQLNQQLRSSERAVLPAKRSTTVLRAEQGLRAADELDRRFGHGKYASNQVYRNPPDDSVYDDWSVLHR